MKNESIDLIEKCDRLIITNMEQYDEGGTFLRWATALVRKIQDYHAPLKKAAKEAHTKICEAEKLELLPLQNAIARVSGLRVGYERLQATIAEKERAKQQALADKQAKKTGAVAPVIHVDTPIVKTDGMHNRSNWSCEVFDAKLVPYEYLQVDLAKLNALARRMKQAFSVPGCRAVEDVNVIVKERI